MLPLAAIPVASCSVSAGFPSPADDYVEGSLDLHELLGVTAPHCYFMRVEGVSMTEAGIYDGDVVLVNRAVEPHTGCVVVACLDGEMVLKRLIKDKRGVRLMAEHKGYAPIEVGEEQELVVWGVVTFSIHDLRVRGAYAKLERATAA
ncbi:hypothetical protein BSZ36_05040 [Rubricoccus marinus]|uniref:Peptidase S24/S26A/S26B/S26C domain-containing protein n=1 Tax=Rubricoccus marinus TaxID=716817 RepID=A0A259U3K7_9BACT|nr:hypothetical protein BSZ36_05040 [Rubricoccus marinus]